MNREVLRERTAVAYSLISQKASSNSLIQGLTGIAGFPFTLVADIVVIFSHYAPMINEIRALYERPAINANSFSAVFEGMFNDILNDLVVDKLLGHIPVLGIYFNAVCAQAMTWRLGMLFSVLSVQEEERITEENIKEQMKKIRAINKQGDIYSYREPKVEAFEELVLMAAEGTEVVY